MTGIVAHTYPEWWLKLTGQVAHWSTDYSAKHIIPAIIHPNAPFMPTLCDKTKFAKNSSSSINKKNAPIRPIKPKKIKANTCKNLFINIHLLCNFY